jgi:hypothetical protein
MAPSLTPHTGVEKQLAFLLVELFLDSGMSAGGQRRVEIPADQGYGAAGAGGLIPPNATLVFDIVLDSFK